MGKTVYTVDNLALTKLLAALSGHSIAPDFNVSVAEVKAPTPSFDQTVTPE